MKKWQGKRHGEESIEKICLMSYCIILDFVDLVMVEFLPVVYLLIWLTRLKIGLSNTASAKEETSNG